MEESIKDLQESLKINKEMLQNILSSGIDDETVSATFYKITEENTKLMKANQELTKERDIALFKSEKAAFETAMNPIIPRSEEVRKFENHTLGHKSDKISLCSPKEPVRRQSNGTSSREEQLTKILEDHIPMGSLRQRIRFDKIAAEVSNLFGKTYT